MERYTLIPVSKEIYADICTPISLLIRLETLDKNFFLLESVEGGEKWARYSFLGYKPMLHITCKDNKTIIKSGEIKMVKEERKGKRHEKRKIWRVWWTIYTGNSDECH